MALARHAIKRTSAAGAVAFAIAGGPPPSYRHVAATEGTLDGLLDRWTNHCRRNRHGFLGRQARSASKWIAFRRRETRSMGTKSVVVTAPSPLSFARG